MTSFKEIIMEAPSNFRKSIYKLIADSMKMSVRDVADIILMQDDYKDLFSNETIVQVMLTAVSILTRSIYINPNRDDFWETIDNPKLAFTDETQLNDTRELLYESFSAIGLDPNLVVYNKLWYRYLDLIPPLCLSDPFVLFSYSDENISVEINPISLDKLYEIAVSISKSISDSFMTRDIGYYKVFKIICGTWNDNDDISRDEVIAIICELGDMMTCIGDENTAEIKALRNLLEYLPTFYHRLLVNFDIDPNGFSIEKSEPAKPGYLNDMLKTMFGDGPEKHLVYRDSTGAKFYTEQWHSEEEKE